MKLRSTRGVRGGIERSMSALRLEAVPSSKPAKENINLTTTILQVEGPLSGSQGMKGKGVFKVGLVVNALGQRS
jgi:hypothetical protein